MEWEKKNELVSIDGNGQYFMYVPGISINDNFQVTNSESKANERIYILAVPYIGGYNPDYSGLDFSETASQIILKSLFTNESEVLKIQKCNTDK